MNIDQSEVVDECLPQLLKFTPPSMLSVGSNAYAGSLVKVRKEKDQDTYQVTFHVPFVVIVADPEPWSRTLANILTAILGSASSITALINQIGTIESDLEKIAAHLKIKRDTGSLTLRIPVHTVAGCTYGVQASFIGKVVVDDNSAEDWVKMSSYVQWNGLPQPPTSNDSSTISGEISDELPRSSAFIGLTDQPGSGKIDYVTVNATATASTDGGMVNTEFSSLYIEQVIVTISEKSARGKATPGTAIPPGESEHPKPGG